MDFTQPDAIVVTTLDVWYNREFLETVGSDVKVISNTQFFTILNKIANSQEWRFEDERSMIETGKLKKKSCISWKKQ